ncbi:uncharacterized protein LOC141608361 [Silene latifolia]|uniref:uncharacterized protein LOC141608361 n=1 Tax=Silene latifolia TaxID=37657 RepID=UPI003D7882B2
MAVVQEVKKLNEKFEKIRGVPASLEEAGPDSYAASPFIDEIAKVDLPKMFVVPSMKIYDGTTDPQNHVALYKQKMLAASIPSEFRQVCMCKGFRTTLIGPALQWTFLARFNKEKVSISRCDVGTTVEAFKQGLLPHSDLYNELTKYPYHTFEDVQAKTLAFIRLEENKSYKVRSSSGPKDYEKSNRKSNKGNNYRPTPCSRPDHSERLDNMGPIVRWPRKVENSNPRRDNSKWCEFYMEVGHTTNDYFTMRKEVAYLLKSGYLKDVIKTNGRNEDQGKEN